MVLLQWMERGRSALRDGRRQGWRTFWCGVWTLVLSLAGSALVAPAPEPVPRARADSVVRVGVLQNGFHTVTPVPIEEYVSRVLVGEALPGSEPAALDALAIAIRTYTAANLARHEAEGFDLCDQTHCQVMRAATPASDAAASRTAGRVLHFRGEPASIYYSASCGGRTEKPSNVWPGAADPPYLPSRKDSGCDGGPKWTTELGLEDLDRALTAAGFQGSLKDVRIRSRNQSGRVALLALEGLSPPVVSGQDLRVAVGRSLGWRHIQSTAFQLRRTPAGFRFEGHGYGHGVGLCVIGSSKLAAKGMSPLKILNRYFPGASVDHLARGG